MAAQELHALLERVDRIAGVVRDGAAESERLGSLAPDVFAVLAEADLFRLVVPVEYGGAGLTIPESVEVYERVARLDASTGWVLAILGGGPLFTRFLCEEARKELWTDPRALVCGTLNPMTARATETEGGYSFSGTATYLSGSQHSKWFMASALVERDGAPLVTEDGIQIRSAVLPIDQARCLDTWHVTGMLATGSSDYAFENVEVAVGWTFSPFALPAIDDGPWGVIPLWAQIGSGLASCAVGAAGHMLDAFEALAAKKVPAGGNFALLAARPHAQAAFGEAYGLHEAARATLRNAVAEVWARGAAGEVFDNVALARNRVMLVTAVQLAARAVDLLHDASGMNAVALDGVLDRCWRDVHTITQHIIQSPTRYEIAGRVLLGLDPGAPVI